MKSGERMSDERMRDISVDLELHTMLQDAPAREVLDALAAERAEVERLATAYVDLTARYYASEAEVERLRTLLGMEYTA